MTDPMRSRGVVGERWDEALSLIVGEEAWECAWLAYDYAERDGRSHRDCIRHALIAAQKAAHVMLRGQPLEDAEIDV